MTEQEWLTSPRPDRMLVLQGRKKRKLRLFACACCRQVWNQFVTLFTVRVVTAAEMYADGEIGYGELSRAAALAKSAATDAMAAVPQGGSNYLAHIANAAMHACMFNDQMAAELTLWACAWAVADFSVEAADRRRERSPEFLAELAAQAEIVRDIFGNPFREVEIDPAWRTSDVLALAQGMYDSRSFGAMPILADALQDAGCDDEEILSHCREPREHVRGCWVIDLMLGKK